MREVPKRKMSNKSAFSPENSDGKTNTKESLRQTIVRTLLADIFHRKLSGGKHLVTQELSQRFQVSHTPIREALIELSGMGIIDLLPNRGAIVRQLTSKDFKEICQLRRLLEGAATQLACGKIPQHFLVKLIKEVEKSLDYSHNLQDKVSKKERLGTEKLLPQTDPNANEKFDRANSSKKDRNNQAWLSTPPRSILPPQGSALGNPVPNLPIVSNVVSITLSDIATNIRQYTESDQTEKVNDNGDLTRSNLIGEEIIEEKEGTRDYTKIKMDLSSNCSANNPEGIEKRVSKNKQSLAKRIRRARQLDSKLHDLVITYCGNQIMSKEIQRLTILFRVVRDIAWEYDQLHLDDSRLIQEAEEHLTILRELLANRPKLAKKAMTRHLSSGLKYWKRSLMLKMMEE